MREGFSAGMEFLFVVKDGLLVVVLGARGCVCWIGLQERFESCVSCRCYVCWWNRVVDDR